MRPTREMYEKEIVELKEALDRYENGYKGSCYACEPVGEQNQKQNDEILKLKLRIAQLENK